MAVDTRAAELNEATKQLARVTGELQKFNESTGVEIAKIVGKDLKKVSDPFVNAFANIPGVQTLGSIGGTLFNKAFAKMKEKKEMAHLQAQLKMDDLEFEAFRKRKAVLDAEKEAQDKLNSAAENILGFSVNIPKEFEGQLGKLNVATGQFVMTASELEDIEKKKKEQDDDQVVGSIESLAQRQSEFLTAEKENAVQMNKLFLDSSKNGVTVAKYLQGIDNVMQKQMNEMQRGGAAEAEIQNELQRREDRRDTLFGSIAAGITDMKKGIINGLSSLKDKGLLGLGVLAGLVAAPFIAISAFFTQLIKEVQVLNTLTKGGLGRFFGPITRFFKAIGDVFGKAGTGQFLRGDTIKLFGRYADDISLFIGRIKAIFAPLMKAAKGSATFMSGFAPIAKFAATIGRTLGKIFLPITILMSIFDFVTGFMEGYKEDGLIGGIREGIISVVDGLVGGLIRMVTGAFAWILEAIGLDKFAASLTENVNDAIEGVYEIFRGVIDVILFPFKLIWNMIKGIFGGETDFGGLFAGLGDAVAGIFDGLINIITAPFDMIYSLVQDIFSFVGFELPDFDLGETITGFVGAAYDFVKDKVKGFFSFLGFGGDAKEEELEKARKEELRLRDAGAVSADGEMASTVRRNGITDVSASEDRIRARGLEVATEEQRAEMNRLATERREQAEIALQQFRDMPKLADAIGAVKEKMSEVFTGIGSAVSSGFTAAKDFVVNLFTFSEEDASIAGIATKLIDIITAPYNIAINFLRGIFGFGEDEQGNIQPFSLGEMIVGVVTDIIDFFKGLFDIDIKGLINSIPGASKILSFFGFGGDDEEETVAPKTKRNYGDEIYAAQLEMEDLEDNVDRLSKKKNRSARIQIEKDMERINQLETEIARLKMMERQSNAPTIVNNNNVVNANTSNNASTTTIAPMRDTSPPAGSIPAYG